jgi:PAS domain S-box-containing protein
MGKPSYEELEREVRELRKWKLENLPLTEQVAKLKERLDLSLSAGNVAWWEWDYASGGVDFNVQKAAMLGYDPKEFPEPDYTTFTDLLHPDDYERVMQTMRDHLEGRVKLYEVEYRIRHKDGRYVWFYDRGAITERDAEGKPLKLKGIVLDYTARKEAELALRESEARLRESNAMKDKFFSIVAHDLRAPFQSLINLANVLDTRGKDLSAEQKERFIKEILATSQAAFGLLENLLQWANAQTGRMEFEPEELAFADVVRESHKPLRRLAEEKEVEFVVDAPEGLTLTADRNMLTAVLRNLLSNAYKFTDKGEVRVSAEVSDDGATIRVKDTGVGMSPITLKNLFRLDSTRSTRGTRDERGAGIGLTLCKDFVDRHGGEIDAASMPGEGSEFVVTLPRQRGTE